MSSDEVMNLKDVFTLEQDRYSLPEFPQSGLVGGVIKIRQKPVIADDGTTVLKKAGVFFEAVKPDRQEESWFQDTQTLECIFLYYRTERAHFSSRSSRTVDCRSYNGIFPEKYVYASSCDQCPMNEANITDTEGKNACKKYTSLLVLVKNPKEKDREKVLVPYTIQVGKSGFNNVAAFVNGVIKNHIERNLKVPYYALKTKITLSKEGGEFYVPVFPTYQYYTEQKEALLQGKGMSKELFQWIKSKREELLRRFVVEGYPALRAEALPSGGARSLPSNAIETSFQEVNELLEEEASNINADIFEDIG